MNRLALQVSFAVVAAISKVNHVAGQQEVGRNMVAVQLESAVAGQISIDGVQFIPGELVELAAGSYTVRQEGPYLGVLEIQLTVSESGTVGVASSQLTRQCTDSGPPPLEVSDWQASVFTVEGLPVLAIQGPTVQPGRAEVFDGCGHACCGWAETRHVTVRFGSLPAGAMILADGEYIDSTDKALSIPYGVSNDGRIVQDVTLRVARTGYIGCTYHLTQLRADPQPAVACQLRRPPARQPR
jgi:hypothetical protein